MVHEQIQTHPNIDRLSSPAGDEIHNPTEFPNMIERSDIIPLSINTGETEIVIQRHGEYIRNPEDPRTGHLTPEAVEAEKQAATDFFERFLAQVPEEERANVDVLIVASDTQYHGGGKRSYETAGIALQAATEVFEIHGIPAENVYNTNRTLKGDGGPREMQKLREPSIFNESPEFLKYLTEKYGDKTLEFWIAFEEDREREKRLELGAEGPDEIADRLQDSLAVLSRYAGMYHNSFPGHRLVVWVATHYDTISPFVKREIFGVGKEHQLQVGYGAGFALNVDTQGNATTVIAGKEYPVPLRKSVTA